MILPLFCISSLARPQAQERTSTQKLKAQLSQDSYSLLNKENSLTTTLTRPNMQMNENNYVHGWKAFDQKNSKK